MSDIELALRTSAQCIALFCAVYVTLIEIARRPKGYGPVDVRTATAAFLWAIFLITVTMPGVEP